MFNLLVIQIAKQNLRDKSSAVNERALGEKKARPGAHPDQSGRQACRLPWRATWGASPCLSHCEEAWPQGRPLRAAAQGRGHGRTGDPGSSGTLTATAPWKQQGTCEGPDGRGAAGLEGRGPAAAQRLQKPIRASAHSGEGRTRPHRGGCALLTPQVKGPPTLPGLR